jgi:hypothetical protein
MADGDIPSSSHSMFTKNDETLTLSKRINTSTRSTHSQLNGLILARLPLALPPYTSNPSIYVFGLLHIAPFYITFESLWQKILDATSCDPTTLDRNSSREFCQCENSVETSHTTVFHSSSSQPSHPHRAENCNRINSILSHLRLRGLLRSGRLRADIKTLSRISEQEVEEQLRKTSQTGQTSEFIAHMTKSVNKNPHILLAYAWVMYMALFAGGRYLRASLQNAGPEFWTGLSLSIHKDKLHQMKSSRSTNKWEASSVPNTMEGTQSMPESETTLVTQCLQFFHFLGSEDGEDIKKEFKERFAEAEICSLIKSKMT